MPEIRRGIDEDDDVVTEFAADLSSFFKSILEEAMSIIDSGKSPQDVISEINKIMERKV